MSKRGILTSLRKAKTQSPIGRKILDKMLQETKEPQTPADFREIDLDLRFIKKL